MEILVGGFLTSVVLLVIGIAKFYKYNNAKKNYLYTFGTIERYEIVNNGDEPDAKIPIINYRVNNESYTIKGKYVTRNSKLNIGGQVKVYYDKDNPKNAIAEGNSGILLLIIGLILFLFFLICFIEAFKIYH